MDTLPKAYDPREVEEKLYKWWEESGFFEAKIDETKEPFVIAMPPPNVTGELHMGHAMFVTLEDIMARYQRMAGKVALWLGHASLQSTEIYLRAAPTEKLEMLDALAPLGIKPGKFRPPDKLIAMLATR